MGSINLKALFFAALVVLGLLAAISVDSADTVFLDRKVNAVNSTAVRAAPVAVENTGPHEKAVAISFDGNEVSYNFYGEGDVAIVFVHGWSGDHSYWDEQIPYFREKYQLVTLDLSGHGNSGRKRTDWSMSSYAQDIIAVIETLKLEKVVLVGHSFGGLAVIAASQQLPERLAGLVIVDELNDLEFVHSEFEVTVTGLFLKAAHAFGIKIMAPLYLTSEAEPALVNKVNVSEASVPEEIVMASLLGEGGYYDFYNDNKLAYLKRVNAPVALINSDSLPTPVESNRKHLPSLITKIISDAGHFLMLEAPLEFNHSLNEFLEKSKLTEYKMVKPLS